MRGSWLEMEGAVGQLYTYFSSKMSTVLLFVLKIDQAELTGDG